MSGMIDDFDQDANPARIIKVNKRRFVVGLAWRPIDKVSAAAKEARLLAKEEDMNLMLIYSGLATQAGFASVTGNEIKLYKGAYSLAAVLADRFGEPSWIGVFELDDGNYVLIAVKDGSITPGYDVVGDIGLIRERAIELKHAFKGATVYLPADEAVLRREFSEYALRDSDLKTLLSGAKLERAHKLGAVSFNLARLKSKPAIALIALALIAAGAGVYYLNVLSDKAQSDKTREQARLAQQRATKKDQARKEIKEASIKPDWINYPNPIDVVRACEEKIHDLPIVLGDWKMEKIDCRATALLADYVRPKLGTTMANFKILASEYPISNAKASEGRIGFKLSAPAKRDPSLDLIDDQVWMNEWISFFQQLQQTASAETTVKHKPHPAPPPPKSTWVDLLGKEDAQLPPPWWTTYTWTIRTTSVMPSVLLEQLPSKGLVLTKMLAERDTKSGALQWTLEGVVNTNSCTEEDTQSC